MMQARPNLYEAYTRKGVRDILAPDDPYSPSSGVWGMRGVVPITAHPGDFAVFVSFGQVTGSHTFDEGINDQGVLRWQSSPSHHLRTAQVLSLLRHDEAINTIYFFLRTSNRRDGAPELYTYLGPLRYHSHDEQRERPVHVAWELVHWPIPNPIRSRMRLELDVGKRERSYVAPPATSGLTLIKPPLGKRPGETTRMFQARKTRRPSDRELRRIGLEGELLVLAYERERLKAAGKNKLAGKVEHVSETQGDGAGYDIRSFEDDGTELLIEVKTTVSGPGAPFDVSSNEVAFSDAFPHTFAIYRLVNYDKIAGSADFYVIRGSLSVSHRLVPSSFRAHALPSTQRLPVVAPFSPAS